MPTEKKLTEPTAEERYQSMMKFLGAGGMAAALLSALEKNAGVLALRVPHTCYSEGEEHDFRTAETALPGLLTEVNKAVEVMNAALGGWIGGGEKVGPDWAALAGANAALLEAAEETLAVSEPNCTKRAVALDALEKAVRRVKAARGEG